MPTNSLLQSSALPKFNDISAQHVVPAITELTEQNKAALEQQLQQLSEISWASLVAPLEEREDQLSKAWSPVSHLNLVCNSAELREAHEQALALLSPYYSEMGQNKKLLQAWQELSQSDEAKHFSKAQQSATAHALRDFHLSGIDLDSDKQQRFIEIQSKLSQLTSQFSNNVLDATQGWFYHCTDKKQLQGLPESIVSGALNAAQKHELDGWVLTLDGPVYVAVMTYADARELRHSIYQAYNTRASDQGPKAGQWDNNALIQEILSLRHEQAELLDFNNYAELSLATKMADNPSQVCEFLHALAQKAKPAAEKDLAELRAWAKQQYQQDELEAWDISYYSEKLRQQKYAVSQEELRQYFTLPRVLDGLFNVANKLYGIECIECSDKVELWHADARYFEIHKNGKQIAAFYLDLYAREGKRGGAWMDVCRSRRRGADGLQLPVAYLVCNFNPAQNDQPALLMHSDVTTLFHEFGHGLHHMLTQIDIAAVSGIAGVEWDAVELPSQFLENWCWQAEVLKELSAHVDSGEALPDDLINKMIAAKNFQSSLFLVRQIEFALFDMQLHRDFGSKDFSGVQQSLDSVREQVAVIKVPAWNRFQCSFSHIFAGGYAAGYYSYLWAEVLSADAFAAFEESSIFDAETGRRFYDCILSQGGSASAAELFRNFRGRDASVDALLRHSGIS
ncbi:M3 family metallopeptidase [Agaribacterium haliotis]|uniref:M3 family metallopeptidase n=1 Tax=Agaribacterium haliotis TaxID=2013869 RepID=UPI000BB538BF|nr:M3 family metallopeptidase [Agaribacterium haliotis]